MSVYLFGDFGALKRMVKKLDEVGQASTRKRIILNWCEEAIDQLKEGFNGQTDPYGKPWKPTQRGGEILADTGKLKASLMRRVGSTEFNVFYAMRYGRYHQSGTKHMVKRMLVPSSARGIPKKWTREFKDIAEEIIDKVLG